MMQTRRASTRTIDMPVVKILTNPQQDWRRLCGSGGKRIAHSIEVDWKKFNLNDYLFSHCSIVSSVATERNGYYIKPVCSPIVNANGNAWTNAVLLATFKSFIGGYNFQEHVQIPSLSKGTILDAVLRPFTYIDGKGNKAEVFICDILVATSRNHWDLIQKIESGQLSTLSMGCFQEGTLVTLANGTPKRIEEFKGGEEVITHTGSVKKVIRPIKTHWMGDMYKIYVYGKPNPIVCTGNHKFLVRTKNEFCACGCGERIEVVKKEKGRLLNGHKSLDNVFKVGHKIKLLNPMVKYSPEELEEANEKILKAKSARVLWKEARDLDLTDLVLTPRDLTTIKDSTVTPSLARVLGLYLAEGNPCNKDAQKEYCSIEFSFGFHEKDSLAREALETLETEMGVKASLYLREGRGSCCVRSHKNKELVQWFVGNGGHLCQNKKLSKNVFDWDRENLKYLVAGWLDGDGTLSITNGDSGLGSRLSGTTTSESLAHQLSLALNKCGIRNCVICNMERPKFNESGNKKLTSWTISISGEDILKIIPYTSRWNNIFIPGIFNKTISRICQVENMQYSTIRKIEKLRGMEESKELIDVYCLEVEDDHSFLVNGGIAVQNCTARDVQCSRCGKIFHDDDESCEHIQNELLTTFLDENGIERIVAELCGSQYWDEKLQCWVGDPESQKFIEASWVLDPAYKGAVVNHFIQAQKIDGKVIGNFNKEPSLEELIMSGMGMRVANCYGLINRKLIQEAKNLQKHDQLINSLIRTRTSSKKVLLSSKAKDNHNQVFNAWVEDSPKGQILFLQESTGKTGGKWSWYLSSLSSTADRLYLDFGQNWFVFGMTNIIKEALKKTNV